MTKIDEATKEIADYLHLDGVQYVRLCGILEKYFGERQVNGDVEAEIRDKLTSLLKPIDSGRLVARIMGIIAPYLVTQIMGTIAPYLAVNDRRALVKLRDTVRALQFSLYAQSKDGGAMLGMVVDKIDALLAELPEPDASGAECAGMIQDSAALHKLQDMASYSMELLEHGEASAEDAGAYRVWETVYEETTALLAELPEPELGG